MDYWEVQNQSKCGFVEEGTCIQTPRSSGKPESPLHILQLRTTVLEMAVMGQLGINGNAKMVKGKKKTQPHQGKNLQWSD